MKVTAQSNAFTPHQIITQLRAKDRRVAGRVPVVANQVANVTVSAADWWVPRAFIVVAIRRSTVGQSPVTVGASRLIDEGGNSSAFLAGAPSGSGSTPGSTSIAAIIIISDAAIDINPSRCAT
jgi:hypothetical protein